MHERRRILTDLVLVDKLGLFLSRLVGSLHFCYNGKGEVLEVEALNAWTWRCTTGYSVYLNLFILDAYANITSCKKLKIELD